MDGTKSTVSLYVNNEFLESGRDSFYTFDVTGGTIGSSESDNWVIQDAQANIQPNHLLIKFIDGAFCLFAFHKIHVNGAYFDANNSRIRLQTGDVIEIGRIIIKISVNMDGIDRSSLLNMPPEYLISTVTNPLEELMQNNNNATTEDDHIKRNAENNRYVDPLQLLESEQLTTIETNSIQNDSLNHLYQDDNTGQNQNKHFEISTHDILSDNFIDMPNINNQANLNSTNFGTNVTQPSNGHNQQFQMHANTFLEENENTYLNPIIKNINPSLNFKNSKQTYDFLEEVGKTIHEAIKGILEIQKSVHISDTQLRPLEDNPLRLSMDYNSTVNMLFSEARSPVHLSAHASVAESLHNVILHQQANIIAIDAALKVLLEAFSPETLEARFKKYRKMDDMTHENDPRWIWEMYMNYYHELISSRQQGFNKLFKEVYDQVYDRELRRLQQGS